MTICRACKGRFTWERIGGKWHALDGDGSSHWASCAGQRKKHGERVHIAGPTVAGEDYTPSCGCSVPPWESCACSALLSNAKVTLAALLERDKSVMAEAA